MGIRDATLTSWLLWLFSAARVHHETSGVWDDCEFLWIDGSLFYRAIKWAQCGPVWRDYLDKVCDTLRQVVRQCPQLRVLVYQIDKYGPGTVDPRPKKPTQDHRYAGCKEVPSPEQAYQPDAPVAGITDTDTFGRMESRMAFNEMVSAALMDCLRELLDERETLELAVLDGAVCRGRPGLALYGDSELAGPADERWCPHSEGDIGLAHWLPRFAHMNAVVHSCDVDLQQVSLQVVRRLCDGGMHPDQLPRMHLYKRVGALVQTFDLKIYYRRVCSVIRHYMSPDDLSHPVDVWAALIAASGNDFCEPWLCSDACKLGEKDNDGIRLPSMWMAFVFMAAGGPPLFEPVTEAERHPRAWSVFKLPAWVYPMRMRVDAWQRLMLYAASMQNQYSAIKSTPRPMQLLESPTYVRAQLVRMSWALCYYANAALIGDRMPRGTETVGGATERSAYGWMWLPPTENKPGGTVEVVNNVSPHGLTVCGLSARDAPTRDPSPTLEQQAARADPLAELERLS